MKKEKTRNLIPKLASFGIICIIIFFLIASVLNFFRNLDYFKVQEIIVRGGSSADFLYLKGRNIFDLNLNREADLIARDYPDYRKVLLVRILPNRVFIDFLRRQPVAYLERGRVFLIDEDAVLFTPQAGEDFSSLPLITGLENKIVHPKAGSKYNLKELSFALRIIREARQNRALRDYRITKIEAKMPTSASFFILENLEIRVSDDVLKDELGLLASLLTQSKDLINVQYIDLRFKEPVIKLKNENLTK